MLRLTKIMSLAALLVAPTMATAAEVNVVSWGGAYTESQKLGYGDPYQEKSGVQVNWIDYSGGLSEIKAQVEAGNIGGAYGLRAQVAGNQNYYTHYAFTGSDSIGAALAEQETLFSSDSFAQFQKEISSNRSVIQTSMLVVMVRYNDEN